MAILEMTNFILLYLIVKFSIAKYHGYLNKSNNVYMHRDIQRCMEMYKVLYKPLEMFKRCL